MTGGPTVQLINVLSKSYSSIQFMLTCAIYVDGITGLCQRSVGTARETAKIFKRCWSGIKSSVQNSSGHIASCCSITGAGGSTIYGATSVFAKSIAVYWHCNKNDFNSVFLKKERSECAAKNI